MCRNKFPSVMTPGGKVADGYMDQFLPGRGGGAEKIDENSNINYPFNKTHNLYVLR